MTDCAPFACPADPPRLVYLDTETTGLDPLVHEVVEVAWAVNHGPISVLLLPHTLANADERALELNGYWKRGLDESLGATWHRESRRSLISTLVGATLVGSNPAFDSAFLRRALGFAPWNHRLLDLGAYAAAVYGWDIPRGMAHVRAALVADGFDIPKPDHSAVRDVETLRACHLALRTTASASR